MTRVEKTYGVADRGARLDGVPRGQRANQRELWDRASYRRGHRSYRGSHPIGLLFDPGDGRLEF